MRLAIMQPYLFPYLGYFQLIQASDVFVVYDDVNYIKGGWINRNFMLANGGAQRFTLALRGASPNLLINQISIGDNNGKLLKSIATNYSKAPYFTEIFPVIKDILLYSDSRLVNFLHYSLRRVCETLEIPVKLVLSSEIKKNNELKGVDKVLHICDKMDADVYINSMGGRLLYDKPTFERCGMKLCFLQPQSVSYRQYKNEFVPNLSIIDILMFNDKIQSRRLLDSYDII